MTHKASDMLNKTLLGLISIGVGVIITNQFFMTERLATLQANQSVIMSNRYTDKDAEIDRGLNNARFVSIERCLPIECIDK